MSKRVSGACLAAAALVGVAAAGASAQERADLAVSYDLAYHEFQETSAAGAHVALAVPARVVRGVAEVGVNRFEEVTVSSFMAGGQWRLLRRGTTATLVPSVQFLLGAWHCCEDTHLALQPGLLVDYRRTPRLAVRVELALRRIVLDDFDDENAFRLSAGLVWRLSR